MAVLLLITGCKTSPAQNGREPQPIQRESKDPVTISRIAVTPQGKPYLEVDGEPFAVYGAQIRIDVFRSVDKMEWKDIEPYFRTAGEFGLNCVQVPLPWKFLEPNQDEYSFDELDQILSLAVKYSLKVELLWFSTNFIGDTYSWLVPNYILSKSALRLNREGASSFHALYGYTYSISFDDPYVLERERLALTTLFAHIRDWDDAHGQVHPVITCQVHNEPDALVRWRLDEKKISWKDGTPRTKKEGWDMTLKALDAAGKAVQASEYKVATRTNIISGNGVDDFPQTPGISPKDVYALDGIDFLSYDPYMQTVNQIASEVSAYASLSGNYPLIAENRGDFSTSASLMLAASALGGGYDIYDLATSPFITSNSAPPFNTEGIFDVNLDKKPHTDKVKRILAGLVANGKDVALTSSKDFAAFNILSDNPSETLTQQIATSGAILEFRTTSSALAFVLDRGDRLVAYSTAEATLKVSGGRLTDSSDNTLTLEAGKTYILPFQSDGPQSSTTIKNIGTIFR